jgi:hypothetical protein
MPLYRFLTTGGREDPVVAEIDLPSEGQARVEAVRYLGELLKDDGLEFWITRQAAMTVSDEAGRRLFVLHLTAMDLD